MDGLEQLISHRICRSFALLALGLGLQSIAAASATGAVTSESKTIVFVCLHGSVKSRMAAAHFQDDKRGLAEVSYWPDVPPATTDYAAARGAIVHHIDSLVPALAQQAHPQETLQGVITVVDERNDEISVWLDSDVSGNFKVQDGLIFNAVQGGERVEITVETLGGAKTIVGLKKL
jgi:uncharacterized membrane protein YidH (DUF202 family)